MTDTQNIFLFVFATMMLAVIVELWSIAKALQSIALVLQNQTSISPEGEKNANVSQTDASLASKI